MSKIIISTVGTSLLTNQINRKLENDWYDQLQDSANKKGDEISNKVKQIIGTLKERAIDKLQNGNIPQIRRASAELNGIYGIYKENLSVGRDDIHYLIATDTAQGKTTAEIVQTFLQSQGLNNVNIYTPPDLSTATTNDFSTGIDELIVWLERDISSLAKSINYRVCFNLVGSFKSLQGYLNTIGMFYADEIIYIFEGQGSDLITIPRLPVKVDMEAIQSYTKQMVLMEAGSGLSIEETQQIPESLLGEINGQRVLSTWGKLIWEQGKTELLSKELQEFPYLEYKDSFREDYKKIKNKQDKVKLQETLAFVSALLKQSQGDISILKKHGGLQYDKYTNMGNIDHFRVTQGLRVSCIASEGTLQLHRYGREPDVNKNPW